jgi:monoamine oxidase
MGLLNKVVVELSSPLPEEAILGAVAATQAPANPFDYALNYSPFAQRNVLVLLSHGNAARQQEGLSPAQLQTRVDDYLHRLGLPAGGQILAHTQWATDPFALGSYMCIPVGGPLRASGTLAQPVGRVFFAGEHCWPSYGYVHGAHQSGVQAAQQVAKTAGLVP